MWYEIVRIVCWYPNWISVSKFHCGTNSPWSFQFSNIYPLVI